jgi:hypothetical protein
MKLNDPHTQWHSPTVSKDVNSNVVFSVPEFAWWSAGASMALSTRTMHSLLHQGMRTCCFKDVAACSQLAQTGLNPAQQSKTHYNSCVCLHTSILNGRNQRNHSLPLTEALTSAVKPGRAILPFCQKQLVNKISTIAGMHSQPTSIGTRLAISIQRSFSRTPQALSQYGMGVDRAGHPSNDRDKDGDGRKSSSQGDWVIFFFFFCLLSLAL